MKKQKILTTFLIAAILALFVPIQAGATIIVTNTAGGWPLGATTALGQSLTAPGTFPGWNDITFAWLDGDTPYASGDMFILTSEYLGAPNSLSAATPGYLAESTSISGGKFLFDSSVTLLANAKYWFMSNAIYSPGDIAGDGDVYAGGEFYVNYANGGGVGDNFVISRSEDADFLLEGSPVPEPATMLLLGSGLIGLAGFRRKFRKR